MTYRINRIHGGNVNDVRLVDFSVNINPLGLPPKIKGTITKNLDTVIRYPQPASESLRSHLASFHNISADNLLIGNGSIEFIYLLPQALKLKRVLIPVPAFSEYEFAVKTTGATPVFIKAEEQKYFKIDINKLAKFIPKVDSIFLCNPNNPTGQCLSTDEILYLAQLCIKRKVKLIIDEAFIDFVQNYDELSVISKAIKSKFILLLRSITKFFAIPGLRLGYLIANEDLTNKISEFQYPWNVNSLAQLAGEEVIKDKDYIKRSKEFILKEKEYLFNNLKNIKGLKVYPPSANFVFCKLENAKIKSSETLWQRLIKRGIVIRNCGNFRGLNNSFFRVAVKKREENIRLISALKGVLE